MPKTKGAGGRRASGDGATQGEALDSILASAAARAEEVVDGKSVFTRASALNSMIGFPTPSLAFSWLIECNVIPFSRIIQIVGLESSGKSAFLGELMRGVASLYSTVFPRGSIHCINNEPKESWPIVAAVVADVLDTGLLTRSESVVMEEWQRQLIGKFMEWEKLWSPDGKGAVGWRAPLFIGLDSLMGTSCEATIAALCKEGAPKKRYPAESLLVADVARSMSRFISRKPVVVAMTNQLRYFTDDMGVRQRKVPGGKAFQFMESFEFELSRVRDIRTLHHEGFTVKLKAHKNCVGISRRSIELPFVWAYTRVGDDTVQEAMWDWPGATINLLRALRMKDRTRWEAINEIVDVHDGRNASLAWSNTLGVPSSGAVSNHELGCLLEERPDLLDQLAPVMGIHRGRFFRAGMDYATMMADVKAAPDSHAARVFRRSSLGSVARAMAAGEIDAAARIEVGRGFQVD